MAAQPVKCPNCRKFSLRTEGQLQNNGAVLLVLGLALSGGMFVLGCLIAFFLAAVGNAKMTDGKIVGLFVAFLVFLMVILIGLSFAGEGLWRMVTGRSTRVVMRVIYFIIIITAIILFGIRILFYLTH